MFSFSVISNNLNISWKVLKSNLSIYLSMRSLINSSRFCSFHSQQIVWISDGCTYKPQSVKMETKSSFAFSRIFRLLISSSMFRMFIICYFVYSSQIIYGSRYIVYRPLSVSVQMYYDLSTPKVSKAFSSLTKSLMTPNYFHKMSSKPNKIKISKVFAEQYTFSCK